MNYEELSDREIDALVAERFFGYRVLDAAPATRAIGTLWPNPTGSCLIGYLNQHWSGPRPWLPTQDDNDARLVRNRIAELGMASIRAYQSGLAQLVWPNGTPSTLLKGADHFAFSLQHATPRQQAIAALQALEAAK